jgi:hypothetical protein
MSRKERKPERGGRLEALLGRGDWRGAGVEARAILADPGASDADRTAAEAARARLRPEPGALAVGAAGLATLIVAVVLGLLVR